MTAAAGTPAPRPGLGTRLVDALVPRVFRLPGEPTKVVVTEGLRIPTRDGVELAADLYRPDGSTGVGTLLVRGPYGRAMPFSILLARIFAARGYQVLFVSSRGTFGSGGEFDPMRTEQADGQDTVAWMREQPWFPGTFGTIGQSYLGHTQWALLADPPPELRASVVVVGPHDFSRHAWGTGALNLDLLEWSNMIAHQEEPVSRLDRIRRRGTGSEELREVLDALPLADAAEKHLQGRAPWLHERLTRPDTTDPYWEPMQHGGALERTGVPVLVVGGWQDLFLRQTVEQYRRLHAAGAPVALTIGPWTHIGTMGDRRIPRETVQWLDEHLAHRGGERRTSPVHVHVTGSGEWRELPEWPPPTTPQTFHLHPGGVLGTSEPAAGAAASRFTYDPADPTPTVGGPTISGGGVAEDSALAARADVLAFTSEPLDRDLEVMGAPRVELAHGTDNPHADLFVRLSEVDRKGRSHNVTETFVRLDPDRTGDVVTLDLNDAAHRFRAGTRIRLLVAGGSHPQYGRNLGTGENPNTGTELRPATHTVHLGDGGGSRLLLPVTSP